MTDRETRATAHAALGDERRLLIVDHLGVGDRTVAELADVSGMEGNLLAHHLHVLESAGLIERRISEGDRRRKYVTLRWDRLPSGLHNPLPALGSIAFVCTHNSARSQFAAALWKQTTGMDASSAGSQPAANVHPTAIRVAAEFDVDISASRPVGYDTLPSSPDLMVSVCDRALEAGTPAGRAQIHWSVPDPVSSGTVESFRSTFAEIAGRVNHLADQAKPDK
jgi:protein-tyrosine-phosphatase/DNA-binding transcriptional ArsR family regulator